jgi:choline dehydrogenase-like flavoprotein
MNIGSLTQATTFSLDVFGRYLCNTFDEALASSDASYRANAKDVNGNPLSPRADMRPFDFIVIGGGTFGAAVAEHLSFRSTGRSERILVIEAGPFIIPEHFQNIPTLGLGTPPFPTTTAELKGMTLPDFRNWSKEVWGLSWRSNVKSFGLAYCIGGRSLFWGGWSPRLLDSETPTSLWPKAILDELNAKKLPNGDRGYLRQSSQQIGVTATNDFIFGELHNIMRAQLAIAINSGLIPGAMPLPSLPQAPSVEIIDNLPIDPLERLKTFADLLGKALPNPLPATTTDLQKLEDDLRNELKLEAPLAVQAKPEHAGYFPMNKFSSIPLLIKAVRTASNESNGDDVRKRVMVVPRCHVSRLTTTIDPDGIRVDGVLTDQGTIPVEKDCKIVIAQGTVESTRLALLSFGSNGRIGSNLMAHLRSNVGIRVPGSAFTGLSLAKALQASALFLKGEYKYKDANGTEDGTVGHFHFQITASGLSNVDTNSEAEIFQKVPDIDTVNQHLNATDSHVVITIRAIGEMEPNNPKSNVSNDMDPAETDFGERRAWVNLFATAKDMQLWEAMDKASDAIAVAFANGEKIDILVNGKAIAKSVDATILSSILPFQIPDPQNPAGKINNPARRDGLGTTHHEAGTMRLGDDPNTSVTDINCRLHGVKNAYVAGPALFPTVGSPNPMLTGIALARRLGDHLLPPPTLVKDPGFNYLFDGSETTDQFNSKWLIAEQFQGGNQFKIVGRSLVAQPGNGIGLLYYVAEQFDNFVLRLDFCLPHPRGNSNDNSGVFLRFRDPRKGLLAGAPGPDVPNNTASVAVDTGYEIQIDEEARGDTRKNEADGHLFNRTGAVYKVQNFGTANGQQNYTNMQQLASGVWHTYEITVTDRSYEVLLNDQPATKFTADQADPNEKWRGRKKSEDPDSGFIGLQLHTGNVAFANIRIQKI